AIGAGAVVFEPTWLWGDASPATVEATLVSRPSVDLSVEAPPETLAAVPTELEPGASTGDPVALTPPSPATGEGAASPAPAGVAEGERALPTEPPSSALASEPAVVTATPPSPPLEQPPAIVVGSSAAPQIQPANGDDVLAVGEHLQVGQQTGQKTAGQGNVRA